MFNAIHRLLLLALVLSAGCVRQIGPVVKISYSYRGGAELADASVAWPVQRRLMVIEGVEKLTLISTKSGTDIYVKGKDGITSSEFLNSVKNALEPANPDLAREAVLTALVQLNSEEKVPSVKPKQVEVVQVLIDSVKSAKMGVSPQAIDASLKSVDEDEPIPDRMKRIAATPVTAVDGSRVLIGDISTLTIVNVPDAVVRTFP